MAYAKVINDTIVNLVVCDSKFAAEHGLMQVPDTATIGATTYNSGAVWVNQPHAVAAEDQAWASFAARVNAATSLADLKSLLLHQIDYQIAVNPR